MRKIAANYIFLLGYPLFREGYVVWENGEIKEVVDTGGKMREIQGLEFYGGMIVSAVLLQCRNDWKDGGALLPFLVECYRDVVGQEFGLAIIKGADLKQMVFREKTVIERLI